MTPGKAVRIFKKEFDRCCVLLGTTDWMVDYGEVEGYVAGVTTQYKYKRCTLTYDVKELVQLDAETIRRVAAHEAIHLLLAPISEIGPTHRDAERREESIVNRLTALVRKSRCTKS